MRRLLPALLLAPLVACGVKEDKFQEEFGAKSCEALFECEVGGDSGSFGAGFFFETEADCVAFYDFAFALGTGGCDYDKKAAKECLAEIDDLSCDASGDDASTTGACAEVYTGDGCGWGETSDTGF